MLAESELSAMWDEELDALSGGVEPGAALTHDGIKFAKLEAYADYFVPMVARPERGHDRRHCLRGFEGLRDAEEPRLRGFVPEKLQVIQNLSLTCTHI